MTKAKVRFWRTVGLISLALIIYIVFNPENVGYSEPGWKNIYYGFSLFYWAYCTRRGGGYVLIELFNKIGLSGLLMALLHYSLAFTCTTITMAVVLSLNIPDIPKAILFISFIGLPAACFQGYDFQIEEKLNDNSD